MTDEQQNNEQQVVIPDTPQTTATLENEPEYASEQEMWEAAEREIDVANEVKVENESIVENALKQKQEEPQVEEEPQNQGTTASDKFAELRRKDKEKRQEAERIQQLEYKLQQQQQQTNELLNAIKQNPIEVLKHLGINDDVLINHIAGNPVQEVDPEVAKLKQELIEFKQQQQLQQQQLQQQQQEQMFINSIQQEVNKAPDDFDLVLSYSKEPGPNNSIELIRETAVAYYNEYKEVPNMKEVLENVEDYLTTIETKRLEKLKNNKKLKNMFLVNEQPPTNNNELINNNNELKPVSINQPTPKDTQNMSDEELYALAVAELDKL